MSLNPHKHHAMSQMKKKTNLKQHAFVSAVSSITKEQSTAEVIRGKKTKKQDNNHPEIILQPGLRRIHCEDEGE